MRVGDGIDQLRAIALYNYWWGFVWPECDKRAKLWSLVAPRRRYHHVSWTFSALLWLSLTILDPPPCKWRADDHRAGWMTTDRSLLEKCTGWTHAAEQLRRRWETYKPNRCRMTFLCTQTGESKILQLLFVILWWYSYPFTNEEGLALMKRFDTATSCLTIAFHFVSGYNSWTPSSRTGWWLVGRLSCTNSDIPRIDE